MGTLLWGVPSHKKKTNRRKYLTNINFKGSPEILSIYKMHIYKWIKNPNVYIYIYIYIYSYVNILDLHIPYIYIFLFITLSHCSICHCFTEATWLAHSLAVIYYFKSIDHFLCIIKFCNVLCHTFTSFIGGSYKFSSVIFRKMELVNSW